ncbi:MAG TPA: hypothetical protein VF444_12355 [Pseudonocardiaceae bacterium]
MRSSSIRSVPAGALLAAVTLALTVAACGPSNASSLPAGGSTASGTGTVATTTSGDTGSAGSGAQGSVSPGPTTPGTSVPGAPPATSGPPVPANQIDASGMPGGGPNGVWTENGGRTIALAAEQAGCDRLTATLVSENARQVVVRLTTTTQTTSGVMCPMIVRQVVATVQLAAPLDGRTLVLQGTIRHY